MPSPFAWEDDDEDQDYAPFGSNPPTPRRSLTMTSFSTPRRVMSESYDQLGGLGEPTPEAPTPLGARLFDPEEGPRDEPRFAPVSKPRTALEDLAAHQSSMPQREKPKWWQRLAAGALGGAAGYLNAGGRNQVNVEPAIAGIYAGDYPRQMGNWRNEQAGLTTRAKIEAEQADDARKREESAARIEQYRAATERARRPLQPRNPPAPPSTYEAKLVRDLESPDPAVRERAQAELDKLKAKPGRAPGAQQQIVDQLTAFYISQGDSEEVAKEKALSEYATRYKVGTEAIRTGASATQALIPQRAAATAATTTTTGIKSREATIKALADKAIADEATQNPDLAKKNVLDPRFYADWDQQMRSEVAAQIQRRIDAKRTPKATGLLGKGKEAAAKGGGPASAGVPTGKTFPRSRLGEYANANNMSVPQAEAALVKLGYTIN